MTPVVQKALSLGSCIAMCSVAGCERLGRMREFAQDLQRIIGPLSAGAIGNPSPPGQSIVPAFAIPAP